MIFDQHPFAACRLIDYGISYLFQYKHKINIKILILNLNNLYRQQHWIKVSGGSIVIQ